MKIFNGMSAQKRLIIIGVFFSTILLTLISALAIFSIKDNLNTCYKYFGQIISKSLAIESVELTKGLPEETVYNTLRTHSVSIIESNEDVAFIEFKDNKANVIYSSKKDDICPKRNTRISISSPLITYHNGNQTIIGSVTIGLSGNVIDEISSMTRLSLSIAFLIAWLTIALIIIMNTIIATRELRTLYDGVKKLSSGEFGYKIKSKGVSREVRELFKAFNDMSEKLHTYSESSIDSIMLERNKFEAILMSIANGVVVCDSSDNVLLVNEHAEQLLDVTNEEIVHSNLERYCDTNGIVAFKEKLEEFKNTPIKQMADKPLEFNIEVSDKILKTVISPMFLNSGEYVGYIIVLIDVTKEVEMDRMRSQFISNVSHELRTPVTVLRSYSDTLYTLGNEFDYETQKEFIGIMNKEVIRLHDMVNDILDFSRYEAKNVKLEKEMRNISELIQECVARADILAKEKSIKTIVMIEPNLPEIPINYDSITRAVMNLFTNAIKYSPNEKQIKIKVEKIKDFVEITVKDEGPGISEENQKKVFDRFFRVENSAHTVKGTGLGLHLVKIAVEKHHSGEVFVKSKLGEGATFGIRLPLIEPIEEIEEYIPQNIPLNNTDK
ncbi:MAG: ATP-binding protein [Candidatus Gastranaerophilales bacterium]|nr:ATP-binding protein [Candidatus Gastranaerophilales bacterium]